MFHRNKEEQYEMEFVCIENLVPKGHFLRRIDKYIDFEFIEGMTKHLYCKDNGRPCVDPVMLVKMMLIGYLYGVRSERQLVKEIEVNIAYRWFLGLKIEDKVPDHSTISQNRRRRFNGTNLFREIFERIVEQAIAKGLVGGKTLYTDSTHLKANANKRKFIEREVEKTPKEYIDELDEAVEADRKAMGKKPLKKKEPKSETKIKKESTTDPDSGYMMRDQKPQGFFYLDHVTVDEKRNIITDVFVTPANIHDSVPYLGRLDYQRERFGFDVKNVGLDAAYSNAHLFKGLIDRGILPAIAYRRPFGKRGLFKKSKFKFIVEKNHYVCPNHQVLKYRTTNRVGFREYVSDPNVCRSCPLLSECTEAKNCRRVLTRHVWEIYKELGTAIRLSDKGKTVYARRKETIERSFANAKQLHGLRYAKYRGLENVTEQCLMTAIAQNIKKIAHYMWKRSLQGLSNLRSSFLSLFCSSFFPRFGFAFS